MFVITFKVFCFCLFSKRICFGKEFPYRDDCLPKTKMVRMVHMNIFYRMDLEIRDQKSEFWTKTENWGFQKMKNSVLGSKIDFWACFQDQNDFSKYSGPFRNHPGSISIYRNIIFNKISPKSRKIDKNKYLYINPSLLSPLGGLLSKTVRTTSA